MNHQHYCDAKGIYDHRCRVRMSTQMFRHIFGVTSTDDATLQGVDYNNHFRMPVLETRDGKAVYYDPQNETVDIHFPFGPRRYEGCAAVVIDGTPAEIYAELDKYWRQDYHLRVQFGETFSTVEHRFAPGVFGKCSLGDYIAVRARIADAYEAGHTGDLPLDPDTIVRILEDYRNRRHAYDELKHSTKQRVAALERELAAEREKVAILTRELEGSRQVVEEIARVSQMTGISPEQIADAVLAIRGKLCIDLAPADVARVLESVGRRIMRDRQEAVCQQLGLTTSS